MFVKRCLIFFWLLATCSLFAVAQDSTLQSTFFTGQLNPIQKKEAMQNVYTITALEIEHLNAQNLNDVLKYVINALPVYLGTDGYNLDYLGNGRKGLQILMNGLPIWQPSMVQFDMSRWPIYDIERIEVLYGTSAILYGTNANVAVINIISKWRKTQIAHTVANVNFSGKNEFNLRIKSYFNFGRHGLSLSAGRYYFAGYQGTDSGRVFQWKPTLTHLGKVHYTYQLMHDLKAFADLNLASATILDRGYPIPNSARVYDNEQQTNNLVIHAGVRGKVSKFHTVDFSHVYSQYKSTNNKYIKILTDLRNAPNPNLQPFDKLKYDSYFSQLKIAKSNPADKFDYESGIEFSHQRDLEQSVQNAVKPNITQFSMLTNTIYRPEDNFWLKFGMRYTNSNKFTTPLLYSVQFKYDMNPQAVLLGQYASGYRTPTFNELFYTYENPTLNILGNLSLQSETYRQLNTSLKIESEDVMVITNMFWQNMNNGIQLVSVDSVNQVYQFVNSKSAKFIGQSITIQTRQKNIDTRFVFANNGVNHYPEEIGSYYFFQEIAAQVLIKIPKEGITLMYALKYNGARSEIRKNALGELEDFSQNGFWMMDASLRMTLGNHLKVAFGVKNRNTINNVAGTFLPVDRLSDNEINSKVPLSMDFGRRGWLSISTVF